MGFDLSIEMVMQMCPDKGRPYYMVYDEDTKALEKVYGIPDVQVPEHLAKYLQGRGRHLEVYLKDLKDDGPEYPYVLLDFYPSFEEVKEWADYEDHWTEEDHDRFRELLEWCVDQKVAFQVNWSY